MSSIIFGQDKAVAEWVATRLGQTGFAGYFMCAIGVESGGELIGGTCFHNYYPKEGIIEMSSASSSPHWLTRSMLKAIFTYTFDFLCCQMVVMRVSADNAVMLNIADRFEFSQYTIPRLRGKNEDEVICTLTDDQWRVSRFNRRPS